MDPVELWRYRDLLMLLAQRDVTVRYKQTLLGVSWALLQPLGPMLVFTLVFTRFIKIPGGEHPYALFVLSGLVPWTYFSVGVNSASLSLVSQANLISKVYFPRLVLPSAAVLARLPDLLVGCALLLVLMGTYGVRFSSGLLCLPAITVLLAVLTFAGGLNLAAFNTIYRDAHQALPLALQLWMFLTPVVYARAVVPSGWRWLLVMNPVTGVIESFRAVLMSEPIPWSHLGLSALFSLVLLSTGLVLFVRMEKHLADYL
ncbi:MAG TPA: ABC transporter permease [Candidatus Acidoferrales bacterium]|nr:ABC transporter permease [Candidatus Acidoferrales bacterium]